MKLEHLMEKVREAADCGIGVMSTGEALSAALVLNRPDWLKAMGYTIAEALDRIDESTIALLRRAERAWQEECFANAQLRQIEEEAAVATDVLTPAKGEPKVHLRGTFVSDSFAPGYRDINLHFDVQVVAHGQDAKKHRIVLEVNSNDGPEIMRKIAYAHRVAWDESQPIDIRDGETKPAWIDAEF